jgi:hypothetical protein
VTGLTNRPYAEMCPQSQVASAGVSRIRSLSRSRVLRAVGAEFETAVSFAGLNQLLGPLLAQARGLSPAYRRALDVALGVREGSSPDQLMLSNAVLELLVEATEAGPVLVLVDDLPWLDRASAGPAIRGDRLLHRNPGDLMAEPQPPAALGEQSRGEDFIHGLRRASRDGRQQIHLDADAYQRRNLQHLTGAADRVPPRDRRAKARRDPSCSAGHHDLDPPAAGRERHRQRTRPGTRAECSGSQAVDTRAGQALTCAGGAVAQAVGQAGADAGGDAGTQPPARQGWHRLVAPAGVQDKHAGSTSKLSWA